MNQFNDERLVTVAVGLLPLQKCINETIEYARERLIFGKTLLDQQYVQFRLAELEAELEATRSLLYRTVLARCQGEDVSMLTAMAKLKIGRLARKVTDQCLQVRRFCSKIYKKFSKYVYKSLVIFSILDLNIPCSSLSDYISVVFVFMKTKLPTNKICAK